MSREPDQSIEAVEEFWNKHVDDWKIATEPAGSRDFFLEIEAYRYDKLAYLADAINFKRFSGKSVLDVGCGVGNDLSRFARAGAQVTGIDLADRSVQLARENFRYRGLQGNFERMNGEQLAFADNTFDAVFCHTVLYFTPHPETMVREIHRVLKPGGEAIIMVVNRHSWMLWLHRLMKTELDHLSAPVFYTFSLREFDRLLSVFQKRRIVPHRFPVRTKIHRGLKARLFNLMFVDIFNALPKSWVKKSGHHLLAYAHK